MLEHRLGEAGLVAKSNYQIRKKAYTESSFFFCLVLIQAIFVAGAGHQALSVLAARGLFAFAAGLLGGFLAVAVLLAL